MMDTNVATVVSPSSRRLPALRRQVLWAALTFALGLPAAQAQVHPDGSTHTTTDTAANGVPIVNIAAPNGRGLSHNRYQQFDVSSQGLILNNSGTVTSTQLAGYVNGNPNLQPGHAATLILNEVTSTLASHLDGVTEVAGPGAQVIIANPNGIECSGCGFINTTRGMLTTGTPILGSDGALSGLHVSGGTITINGAGLDGSNIDRLDLVARAVTVNAGVWAKQLNVVTGANRVDYSTLTPHNIAGSGTAPTVALDVAALGGMYAGVIRLVGTEAGIGVNNRGQLAAQSGDLTLTSAGQVVLGGKTSATGKLSIATTQSVTNTGTLAAGGAVTLAGSDLANAGTLYSDGAMTLNAGGQLTNGGTIQVQGGTLALHAGRALSNAPGGSVLANGAINLSAASLDNAGKLYALGGGWTATVEGAFDNQAGGDIYGSQGIALTATSLLNAGAIEATQDAAASISGALTNTGHIQSDQGNVTLAAGSLDSSGAVSAQRALQVQVADTARNSGTLVSGQAMALSAGSLENTASGQVQSGTDLTLSAAVLDNAGNLHAKGSAAIDGGDLVNDVTGMLLADGALTVHNTGAVRNAGLLQADSDLTLDRASSLANAAGATVYAGHDLNLSLTQALGNDGLAYGAHAATIAAGNVDNSGILRSGGSLSLASTGDVSSTGAIQAQQDLQLASGTTLANGGKLYAVDGRLDAHAGGAFTSSAQGDIYSGQDVTIAADSLTNAGLLEAGLGVSLGAQGDLSNSGTVQADQGDLAIAGGRSTNQGALSATGNMQLSGSIRLSNLGQVVAGQALTLTSADLRNSGQTQSGSTTLLQAATLDNSGRIQAGSTLAVTGNHHLDNEATGQLLAAGDIHADTGVLLGNAGVIQAGGNLGIDGAGAIDNQASGILYGTRQTTLQLGGALDNAGTLYGAQNLSLSSHGLTNTGSLRSDAGLQLDVQGDASSSGVAYAAGDAVWNVSGALANTGTVGAGGDTTVTAGSLTGTGTLAAGLQGDGTLASSGTLHVGTVGVLASSGRALAGGDLILKGSAIDLSGSQTRAGGNATLTATQGSLSNQGGDLAANGTLMVSTPGALLNGGADAAQGGKIAAQVLVLQTTSLDNRYGSLTQNGSGDLALSFAGALDNAHGTLASNADNLTLSAASLDNSGGTIQHAGNGTLSLSTSGDLINNGGQVAGNGALVIHSGGVLGNVGGSLGVAGGAAVHAVSMDNSHGTLAAAQVGLGLDQALTNIGGTLQAADGMTVGAGTLDNTDGYLKATGSQALDVTTTGALTNASAGGAGGFLGGNGAVTVHAGSLRNGGQIYAGNSLTVASQGALVNDSGALQAMSSLDLSAVLSLSNRNGRIESGAGDSAATLAVNAGSIDNTAGRLANAGQGASTIGAGGSIVNRGGTLGGQGNTTLNGASLDNSQAGHVVAGQNLTLGLGGLNNAAGTLYAAANLAWSKASAHLANASGNLGAGGSLGLGLQSIDNSGGAIAAGSNVNLSLSSLTGAGRMVAGQDLSLTLPGSYSNGGGNTLKGNRDLTLNLGGNFSNAGGATLTAVRNLSVTASNIDNAAGADINSAGTTLTSRGSLANAGRIEGDAITLKAGNLTNTGTIIGGNIGVNASNLTNGSDLGGATSNAAYQDALIAATDGIDLFVSGTLLNRDATIFTLGNLRIGANASGGRSAAVINRSGDIEADGSVSLAANQFTNQRRVFKTSTYNLSATEQAQNTSTGGQVAMYRYDDPDPLHHPPYVAASQVLDAQQVAALEAYCGTKGTPGTDGDQWCNGITMPGQTDPHVILHNDLLSITTSTLTAVQRLTAASAESRLLAGGDITLNGSVLNDKSTIAAGNNLVINGQNGSNGGGSTANATVQNIAWMPTGTVQQSINEQTGIEHVSYSGHRHWGFWGYETWGYDHASVQLGLGAGKPGWITYDAGQGLAATMSAGNTVSITAHTINNAVVGADGKPVHAVLGLGQNGGGQAVSGGGNATVGRVAGAGGAIAGVALGNAPAASSGGSLSLKGARSSSAGGGVNPASPQVVATLGGSHPSVTLPQSGLYTVQTNPSSPYLIETDPRFTQYSQFISSDYMMDKLDVAPADIGKRLGDGFYEQRSVLDQVASLTGRRFLDDNTDALSQYRSLMDAGVQEAQQFDLSVGIALTPEQMANLTQDMVWMVTATVDGQQVLVPVVYLSADHARQLAAGGATIAGKNVILTASGDITNNGTISASDSAQLTAANLLNSGTLSAGNDLSVNAAQDILNGGIVNAGGNVSLVAGNDVRSGLAAATALGAVDLTGLGGPVSTVALGDLKLPGSIHVGGDLSIGAGRDLSLDTAPVAAGGNLALAAGRDLTATATAISAGKDAQLLAGRDLGLLATGRTVHQGTQANGVETTTHTVDTLSAGGNLLLAAGRDATSQGASLAADNQLALSAGHDVNLAAVTDTRTQTTQTFHGHTQTSTSQYDETLRGTALTGANGVAVTAGHDLTATAGNIAGDQGNVMLAAGHDLALNAGEEDHSTSTQTTTRHSGLLSSTTTTTHDTTSDSYAIGTAISGSNIALSAGHDLTTQGTQVSATQDIGVSAGHDVLLGAAQDTHSEEHDRSTVKRGGGLGVLTGTSKGDLFSRTHKVQQDSSSDTVAVGSLLSGDHVTVAAGHDLTTQAAQIAGTHDVVLAAGHDLTIGTADNTHSEDHSLKVNTYGAQRSGLHGMFGVAKAKQTASETDTTPTGSLIGSTDGAVTLSAGQDVHITGSDVISQTGTAIVGQNVTIDAAVGTADSHQTQSLHTGGIMAGLTGGAATAAEQAWASGQRAGQVRDKRLKALYAAQAAQDLFSPGAGQSMGLAPGQTGAGAMGQAAKGNTSGSGVSLRIGIGASSASAHSDTHDDISYGSHIRSNGDVTIAATNGDLNLIGSQVSGSNVALAASHDLNLLSQAEHHTQSDHSANARGEVGFSMGSQTGFYATADGGKGLAHGNGTSYIDSNVTANNTLSLLAGNDATIRGAQAKGNTVLASIGHDLTLESQQATNDFASHSWQAGGTFVYGSGSEVHASAGMVDSNYQSVQQVSGIGAGSGGFQVHVGGNTALTGAVIASTADSSLNLLDTGTLSFSDLKNSASYSAMSAGISVGSNGGTRPSIGVPQFGDKSSTTRAGVAEGTIQIRANPSQDVSGLDRNPDIDASGLKTIFNAQKVAENQELGNMAGQVGMTAAGDLATYEANHATTEQEQKDWSDGGRNKVLLHGLVGAGVAAVGGGNALQGALGAGAGEASIPYLQSKLGRNGVVFGSTLIGGVVGGGSGLATANAGVLYNYLNHQQRAQRLKDLSACKNAEACQKVEAHWAEIDANQNVTEGQGLLAANQVAQSISPDHSGFLTPAMSEQLMDTNPLSQAYTDLLVQGVTNQTTWLNAYASAPNIDQTDIDAGFFDQSAMQSNQVAANNAALPGLVAMLRSVDGDPAVGAEPDMTAMLINRNRLVMGVLGPVFGGGGAAADVFGASPQQVAAANDMGAAAFYMAGAAQFEPLNGFSEAMPASEMWTSSAIDAGVRWGEGIQNQGMPWENYLANQLPAGSQLPPNFKTFDFYDPMTQTAISAKTLDTQGLSYLSSPTKVYSTLEGYIDSATNFTEYRLSGRRLDESMIPNRELHVAVPEQTTPQQWQQINQAIQYGQSKGVKVVVTPVQ